MTSQLPYAPGVHNQVEVGRGHRMAVPPQTLAQLVPSHRGALDILVEQNADRLQDLVPLRFARMLTDPFSFYRGSAALMAADLADGPSSGVEVMCSGDAHVSNFGIFASLQRDLVFGLNDFDEAAIAPAEWDVKRLTTSAIVGARQAGYSEKATRSIAAGVLEKYRAGVAEMLHLDVMDRYYQSMKPRTSEQMPSDLATEFAKTVRTKTSAGVFARIMEAGVDGKLRIRENPPILTRLGGAERDSIAEAFDWYRARVRADVAVLLSQFTLIDVAHRVVGVGSVGTRCYVLVLTAPDGTPLILQIKQANRSVLEDYGKRPQPEAVMVESLGQGRRVVDGQHILQALSDVFLSAVRSGGRDFYVRQFRDMKGTIATEGMSPKKFGQYAHSCGLALARAHTESPNAAMLRGYVGDDDVFTSAILEWSYSYATKALDDYNEFRVAAQAGDIPIADDPLR